MVASHAFASLSLVLLVLLIVAVPNAHSDEKNEAAPMKPRYTLHPDARAKQRIVGGTATTIDKYPFQAAVAVTSTGNYYFQCGGTLIDDQWILTAAHCLVQDDAASQRSLVSDVSRVHVGLGITNYDFYSLNYNVDFISMHPSYVTNDINTAVDMAMIHITVVPTLSSKIQLADLATSTSQYILGATTGTIIGWGATAYGAPTETVLREVNVPIVTNAECTTVWHDTIPNHVICAGTDNPYPKDTCSGDSGGPLLINSGSGYIQVGITSVGIGPTVQQTCSGRYTFYTEVAKYYSSYIQPQIATGPAPCATCRYSPNGAGQLDNWVQQAEKWVL